MMHLHSHKTCRCSFRFLHSVSCAIKRLESPSLTSASWAYLGFIPGYICKADVIMSEPVHGRWKEKTAPVRQHWLVDVHLRMWVQLFSWTSAQSRTTSPRLCARKGKGTECCLLFTHASCDPRLWFGEIMKSLQIWIPQLDLAAESRVTAHFS